MLPCYQWNRGVVAPSDHPILKGPPLTLGDRALADCHLRLGVYRAWPDEQGLSGAWAETQCGADGHRLPE